MKEMCDVTEKIRFYANRGRSRRGKEARRAKGRKMKPELDGGPHGPPKGSLLLM